MLRQIPHLRRTINASEGMSGKQKIDAWLQLSKLISDIHDRQPAPPKKRDIDFGVDQENLEIQKEAQALAADITALMPGDPETGAKGGPGPRS